MFFMLYSICFRYLMENILKYIYKFKLLFIYLFYLSRDIYQLQFIPLSYFKCLLTVISINYTHMSNEFIYFENLYQKRYLTINILMLT